MVGVVDRGNPCATDRQWSQLSRWGGGFLRDAGSTHTAPPSRHAPIPKPADRITDWIVSWGTGSVCHRISGTLFLHFEWTCSRLCVVVVLVSCACVIWLLRPGWSQVTLSFHLQILFVFRTFIYFFWGHQLIF